MVMLSVRPSNWERARALESTIHPTSSHLSEGVALKTLAETLGAALTVELAEALTVLVLLVVLDALDTAGAVEPTKMSF